jgi:signal transduction histidine kinase
MSEERLSVGILTPGRLAWMLANFQPALLERWARRVLSDPEVPAANRLSAPALEDHIPHLVARLTQRLARHPKTTWGEEVGREVGASDLGTAHAQHRVQADYSLSEALRELSHFRASVLDLCVEHGVVLNYDELMLLHATIDETMRTSAAEFERATVSAYDLAMGMIAHDLRSPLNAISMYAEGLLSGELLDAKAGEVLARNARIMERLVEDLLVYSKIETGHFAVLPAEVDLCALVRVACESYQPVARRRRVELTWSTPPSAVVAFCDGDRLMQALGNLIGNGIKFTPEGGAVRVELEVQSDHCVLRVADTGPGIPPEQAEEIFRPFWRGPGAASSHGAGLGLAIARGILEAHSGELRVEAHPPPGATFVLTLPGRGRSTT